MLKNYCKLAIRHLTRHKLFAIINIACLAIGLTFSIAIGSYILDQLHVNSQLKDVTHHYLLKSNWKVKEMGLDITTLGPLAKTIKEEYPALVKNYYRFNPVTNVISAGDKYFKEDVAIGDTSLITMYGFPLLYGNKEHAFANDQSALITETMAIKLFGRKDVLNRTISLQTTSQERQDYTISAVLKDIPFNSVSNLVGDTYNVYLPAYGSHYYSPAGGDTFGRWEDIYEVSLIQLQPGVSPQALTTPFKQVLAKYAPAAIQDKLTIEPTALKDYHLQANNGAVQKMITTLSLVAVFILLMAVINFININIGTSSYRLKEIGLRKVFGSAQWQLMIQFITEALLLTLVAAILSIVLYQLCHPLFNQIFSTPLATIWHFGWQKISLLLVIVLLIGLASGVYPAFVLSASNVATSVKGKLNTAQGGLWLRKSLLVVQFTLAIVVFISAVHVSRQISYLFHKDLGYNKDRLLIVTAFPKQWDDAGIQRMENIKQSLLQLPAVKSASLIFEIPDRLPPNASMLIPEGSNQSQATAIHTMAVDEDYASTFGLQETQGYFFNHKHGPYVPLQLVLTESAVKALGWKDAVGKKVTWDGTLFTIAGVVKDFNYSSLHDKSEPLAMMHVRDSRSYRFMALKLNTPDITQAVAAVRQQWKTVAPNTPFEYAFMDDKFQALYEAELQLQKAASTATVLNFVIVFMGIFGIIAFTLSKRLKEVAIRRVLGADLLHIIYLFIKDYVWLILIANMIAWPIAYFTIHHWLENYAYKIQQGIAPYLLSGTLILVTAAVLIAAQCAKAAGITLVKNLRTE